MKPASPGLKLTYDDFVLFPDDGKRHELIDGEHYVTPSPNVPHQTILGNLHLVIASWLEAHPIGRVFLSPLDVVFTQFDVVEPDLLYCSNERAAQILTTKNARRPGARRRGRVAGTRRRDDTISRLYERSGVADGLSTRKSTLFASIVCRVKRSAARRISRARMFWSRRCCLTWNCRSHASSATSPSRPQPSKWRQGAAAATIGAEWQGSDSA
jgi:hypothetical protein